MQLSLIQSSTTGREKKKEKLEQILSLLKQLECIIEDKDDQRRPLDNSSKQNEGQTESATVTKETLAALLAEKDDQIRSLKEQSDKRYQQIKSLEEQKRDRCEQAKQFEIDFQVEAEENQLLRAENEVLRNQLDSGFDAELCDEGTNEAGSHRKVVSGMKAQIKDLNDDVLKLRNHSKEQSRQILKYKQQVEVSEVSSKCTL